MIFNAFDGFVRTATSPDGLSWTVQAGKPFNIHTSLFRFVRVDSTHVRAFFACSDCAGSTLGNLGIHSAITTDDGATWTIESGVRITAASVGATSLTGLSVVHLTDGRWRGYFAPSGTASANPIYSATSTDLLN